MSAVRQCARSFGRNWKPKKSGQKRPAVDRMIRSLMAATPVRSAPRLVAAASKIDAERGSRAQQTGRVPSVGIV